MKPGGGKVKGGKYEREICRLLSRWLTRGKNEDIFWRSAMSGGRATVAHRAGRMVRQCGDICAVAPEGHAFADIWFVECKHVKYLNLERFVILNKGPLADFWRTAKVEAKKHRKWPMLIAKQNGWTTPLVLVRSDQMVLQPKVERAAHDATIWTLDDVLKSNPEGWTQWHVT